MGWHQVPDLLYTRACLGKQCTHIAPVAAEDMPQMVLCALSKSLTGSCSYNSMGLIMQDECRCWDVNDIVFSPALWPVYQSLLRADFSLFDQYKSEHQGQFACLLEAIHCRFSLMPYYHSYPACVASRFIMSMAPCLVSCPAYVLLLSAPWHVDQFMHETLGAIVKASSRCTRHLLDRQRTTCA